MLDESMFEDIHEIAENSAYLKAVEEKDVSLEMYESLPAFDELSHLVNKLESDGKLNFDSIFNEPTGFYMIKCFLISDYCVDKAIFIKDVRAYKSMRFESARRRVASLLYQRFVCADENITAEFESGTSVFDIIRQKGNDEKRSLIDKSELKSDLKAEKTIVSSNNQPSQSATVNTNMVNASLNTAIGAQPSSGNPSNLAASTTLAQSAASSALQSPFQTGFANNPIGVYGKCVRIVKEKVISGQAPKDLFDDVYREVLNDLKLDAFPRFRQSEFFKRYIRTKWIETKAVNVKDFTTFRVLGRGGFGAVHACRKKNSGAIYAMKAINKKLVKVKSALDNVLEERNVLVLMKSDFVTNIKYALQDEETLYLVMDLMLGGDLKFHLINAGRFPEKRAKFYAAQVLLGLEHIHKLGIIYRDMKLENVLLDDSGNVKLSDLGLAVVTKVKIKGYAGCLEENEEIMNANGTAIRVGDLQEDYPSTWPMLLTESGEPQKIHRVYRGKSKYLWSITDSQSSYRVTFTHRLALKWTGESATESIEDGKFILSYAYESNDDIKQRAIEIAFDESQEQNEIPRSKPALADAKAAAWKQFEQIPAAEKIVRDQIIMVTLKNYLDLPEQIQDSLREFNLSQNNQKSAVSLPKLKIDRVEREDSSFWHWVGVEVEDSRHRVILKSGAATGNTPGYTAPEMIKNKLYGPSADIFSYGVMLYRMLCGSKPFKGKIDRDLDKAVIEKKPQFPKEIFSKEATSLLTGLLQKRPEHRLGCTDKGVEEIKEHPFFESIDWGLLEAGYIDPPFVPNKFDVNAASLKDIGDFDRAKYKHVKLDERFKQRIKNFEYVSARALQDEMVAVLFKADENVKFEKFAPKAQVSKEAATPATNGCCVVV